MKQSHLKTHYEYLEEAKREAMPFYRNLPDDKILVEKLLKQHKVKKTKEILEQPQEDAGLRVEILAFLPDCMGRQEALQLFQYEVWANFASLLPDTPIKDRNGVARYFEGYVTLLTGYQYTPMWFLTDTYQKTDFEEILAVERYCLFKYLERSFVGFEEDLPVIVKEQKKVRLSLIKAIYKLDFLDIKINIGYQPDDDTDTDYQIQKFKAYLEDVWLKNDDWFLYEATNLQSRLVLPLQERLASFQFEQEMAQKNAPTQKKLSYYDLQNYVQHYKATNKIKQSVQARIEIEMQSGTFSMQTSTRRYWWRLMSVVCLGSLIPLFTFLDANTFGILGAIMFFGGLTSWALADISRKFYSED